MKPILLLSDEPEIMRLMLKQVTSGGFFGARRCSAFLGRALATLIQNFSGKATQPNQRGKGYNCETFLKKS
jgi:hypothetical protein